MNVKRQIEKVFRSFKGRNVFSILGITAPLLSSAPLVCISSMAIIGPKGHPVYWIHFGGTL